MPVPARSSRARTRWWRFYDLMWGIHIMDLKTREDAHNPLVVGFAIASLVMSLLALVAAAADAEPAEKAASLT